MNRTYDIIVLADNGQRFQLIISLSDFDEAVAQAFVHLVRIKHESTSPVRLVKIEEIQ